MFTMPAIPCIPTPSSGIILKEIDLKAKPQVNFDRYANLLWNDRTEIPRDKTTIGAFYDLRDQAEIDIRTIINHLAANNNLRERIMEKRT